MSALDLHKVAYWDPGKFEFMFFDIIKIALSRKDLGMTVFTLFLKEFKIFEHFLNKRMHNYSLFRLPFHGTLPFFKNILINTFKLR